MNYLDQLLFEDAGPARRDRVLPQARTGSPLESGVLRRQVTREVCGGGRSSGNCALKWYGLACNLGFLPRQTLGIAKTIHGQTA